MAEKFTTEPCAICGGVDRHQDGCPADPTWNPLWYEDREGQAHECPRCKRLYAYAENADRCPCEPAQARCELCEEPMLAEDLDHGLCPSCTEWIEDEADKAEARRLREQGRPWF
jgi:hypothetical protein